MHKYWHKEVQKASFLLISLSANSILDVYKYSGGSPKNINSSGSANSKLSKCFIIKADEMSNDVMKHEESTQNPLTRRMHPDSEWDSKEQYSTNTPSEETLPGIIPPNENEHKNTSVYTGISSPCHPQ